MSLRMRGIMWRHKVSSTKIFFKYVTWQTEYMSYDNVDDDDYDYFYELINQQDRQLLLGT